MNLKFDDKARGQSELVKNDIDAFTSKVFETLDETQSDPDQGMTPQFLKQKKPANALMPRRNSRNTIAKTMELRKKMAHLDKSSSNGSELLVGEQANSKPGS